eukprot:TRINITY_DN9909_c0_g1_i1.p1 TRINITY_DN9909_c0_g1~~TRINITY_DN9909_c0_g1_i1.p1  ORF type:complete len:208 (-),score=28.75 TRINITY_DN9909_c0_g1_i1:83-652(-)
MTTPSSTTILSTSSSSPSTASSTSSPFDGVTPPPHLPRFPIGKVDAFIEGGASCVSVPDRTLAVFKNNGILYAIDNRCYHSGGPLTEGDIEDYGGTLSVRCPWHSYHIALETGEGLYLSIDGHVKSKGVKQRTHRIEIEGNDVYVYVSSPESTGSKLASDHYEPKDEEERKRMGLGARLPLPDNMKPQT